MRNRIAAIVMAVILLLVYLVLVFQRAIMLIATGEPIAIAMGVALLVLPVIAAWAIGRELLFGARTEKLVKHARRRGRPAGRGPAAPGERPAAARRRRRASSRSTRPRSRPRRESWRAWFRLGLAYDASGDRRRARAALRESIRLYRADGAAQADRAADALARARRASAAVARRAGPSRPAPSRSRNSKPSASSFCGIDLLARRAAARWPASCSASVDDLLGQRQAVRPVHRRARAPAARVRPWPGSGPTRFTGPSSVESSRCTIAAASSWRLIHGQCWPPAADRAGQPELRERAAAASSRRRGRRRRRCGP